MFDLKLARIEFHISFFPSLLPSSSKSPGRSSQVWKKS